MENVKFYPYFGADYVKYMLLKGLKMATKSYFLIEIFRQKKEMSSFVL